jgi:murein DD-endopeptidase MepM/ murein hydrolase activator NlpD
MTSPMHAAATPGTARSRRTLLSRTIVAVVVSAAVIAVTTLGPDQRQATADAITDKIGAAKQALSADGTDMTKLRAELAAAANQEAGLRNAIADLDTQISHTQGQVSDAQKQLDAIQLQLETAQTNLADTQTHLAFERRQLSLEIVVMYKAQNASNDFTNFLNSGDFNSLWQHVVDVHRLGASEQQLIATVTSDEQTIQDDVTRIATEKSQQQQLLATLRGIVVQLNDALSTRQTAEQQLVALQASDQQALAQAEQSAKELNAQIAALNAEEAAALAAGGGNGHFAWPETGPISQGFGCTDYPREPPPPPGVYCASGHYHTGLDIAAACGNNITAADSGIAHVYYSSYGYGDHIIIVHGNGWVSVYGHMWPNFAVSDGQTVQRGQLVGHEGSTGNSSGCHLHFEVDLNGVARNPLAYLS